MNFFHANVSIIGRSSGKTAVAAAAYRSGERLYNEETGLVHDFRRKGGVIMNEILLPGNAPDRLLNREVLWNEVQKIESRSDAQLAREVEVALPREMSRLDQIECTRNFIKENFVDQGMIADWALHDKGTGNPHVHIMLTMRSFTEDKNWNQKGKSVFANARDENGKPIFDPNLPAYDPKRKEETSQYRIPVLDENGNQKTRKRKGKGTEYLWERIKIRENDWDDLTKVEQWRASWAEHCNRYLDEEKHIDHRSYKRQGLDILPTIHEGVTARQMERNGKISDRCQINREVREYNEVLRHMKESALMITKIIIDKARAIGDRFKKLRRSNSDVRRTGEDDGYPGRTADTDRDTAGDHHFLEGTADYLNRLKQTVGDTAGRIKDTDRSIAETEQRIAEMQKIKAEKENIRYERLRKLTERRSAFAESKRTGNSFGNGGRAFVGRPVTGSAGTDTGRIGADAGRTGQNTSRAGTDKRNTWTDSDRIEGFESEKRGVGTDDIKTASSDIREFLSNLLAQERAGEEEYEDKGTWRECESTERERGVKSINLQSTDRERETQRRGRSR